jgi:uncharacterized delta-60 repeat protein
MAGCRDCDTAPRFAVARWTTSGEPDEAFSGDGIASAGFGAGVAAVAFGVAIDASDRVVAAGNASDGGTAMAVARFLSNGTLDEGFSGDGRKTVGFAGGSSFASAVAVLPSGKILVGGSVAGADAGFALVRLTDAGAVDPSFGTEGRVTTLFGAGDAEATAMAVRSDGRIILAGVVRASSGDRVAIARYTADGQPDDTLDDDGRLVSGLGLGTNVETSGLVADGNRIVVSGTLPGDGQAWFVARFTGAGVLDTSYNGTGVATVGIGGSGTAHAMALTPDGKYVVVGGSGDAGGGTVMTAAQFVP